uniref:Uncharacterized protein n=1 Tax=Fagus sylvatica TaxID=28930 RepID=A0A2N9GGV8_FAGSY
MFSFYSPVPCPHAFTASSPSTFGSAVPLGLASFAVSTPQPLTSLPVSFHPLLSSRNHRTHPLSSPPTPSLAVALALTLVIK